MVVKRKIRLITRRRFLGIDGFIHRLLRCYIVEIKTDEALLENKVQRVFGAIVSVRDFIYILKKFKFTQRTDQVGCSVEIRARFGPEVLKVMTEAFGGDVAIKFLYFTEANKLNLAFSTSCDTWLITKSITRAYRSTPCSCRTCSLSRTGSYSTRS